MNVASPWAKVTASTAEVCRRCPLGEAAAPLVREAMAPREVVDLLAGRQLFVDAVRFLAFALPKREAVWWACLCARAAGPSAPAALAALEAAERWAARPTDEHRRTCLAAAEAADFGTPAGCAAVAAFWSEGSLAPPGQPAVPPKDDLTPGAVANAVILAAVAREPQNAPETFARFLALGGAVAAGTSTWPDEAPPPPSPRR